MLLIDCIRWACRTTGEFDAPQQLHAFWLHAPVPAGKLVNGRAAPQRGAIRRGQAEAETSAGWTDRAFWHVLELYRAGAVHTAERVYFQPGGFGSGSLIRRVPFHPAMRRVISAGEFAAHLHGVAGVASKRDVKRGRQCP